MNQPPNSGMNQPPGYGVPQQPQGYGPPPQSGPVPQSGSYGPPPSHGYGPPPSTYQQPHGMRGMTRQMFNPASYRQVGSGSWAAASLILSLVSAFLCFGLISPIPMVLGLVGMIGQKRAKGMAFAGFMISALQVVGWVAVMGLGLHLNFQSEGLAEDAGKPVVAAISQFKEDNKRVPHSLDELVSMGYLPPTWDKGHEEINDAVTESVKGKKWQDFLAYNPGGSSDWVGEPSSGSGSGISIDGDWDEWKISVDDKSGTTAHQSYGLTFIGIDGIWGTTDDAAVKQTSSFELSQLWGGDETTREAMKKRRELQRMMKQVEVRLESLVVSLKNADDSLAKHDHRLREVAARNSLTTAEQVKSHPETSEWVKLIGETNKLREMTVAKQRDLQRTHNKLEVQMERLANQVELAKLADNKEQLAELQTLLDESKAALDGDESSYFSDKTESDFADDWLKKNFK